MKLTDFIAENSAFQAEDILWLAGMQEGLARETFRAIDTSPGHMPGSWFEKQIKVALDSYLTAAALYSLLEYN